MEAAQAGNQYLAGNLANGGATAGTQAATASLLSVPGVDTAGIAGAANRLSDPNNIAATTGARIAGGAYNLDASAYERLNAGLAGPSQTQRSLQDVADGKYLGGANPYLDDIISRSSNDAATKVAQQFSASGRYGSGRFAGATADAVAGIGTQARYQDYEAERQRQAQAAQAIDSGLLARTGASAGLLGAINDTRTANAGQAVTGANLASSAAQQGLAGQQALAGVQQANNAQRIGQYGAALSGAQSDRAAALAGLGAVGQSRNDLLAPGQTLTSAGAVQDAARQDDINAMLQMFNEQQQSPWKQLGLLSELAIPVAGTGGTGTSTTQQQIPQPGLLQQILGGGLATAGILGQTGAFSKPDGSAAYIRGGPQDPAMREAEAAATARGTASAKTPDDFTLRPGEVRYGADGQPIVSARSDKPENFDTESKLRAEFSKGLGSFADVHDGYGRVIAATQERERNPTAVSPASDMSLVFGFMKMLDPTSVVREGEYATAKNAAGIPDQFRNAYNKAVDGEFLTPQQRQDFVNQSAALYGKARSNAEGVAERYRGLAGQYGVDPGRSVYLPEMPKPPQITGGRASAQGGALGVGGTRDMGGGITVRRVR